MKYIFRYNLALIFTLLVFILITKSVRTQIAIDLESGLVFTGYNNIRIPGDNGTLFSFKDDLKPKTTLFFRLRASYTINSRHTFSLLYAPLQIRSEGSVSENILFEDRDFPANTQLKGTYKFNSYRVTYRYRIINKPKIKFGLGFTAKIRDAKIELSSGGLSAEKANVGFVPIINFRVLWNINSKLGFLLEGDALAAPQGRAEDIIIAATYSISDHIIIRGGYRILEGGADNAEVYNFALFNYASVGITYIFKHKSK